MNKTKVVASIGPESYRSGILEDMVVSGADVIRLNTSYSDYNFCKKVIAELEILNKKLNSSISIMLDIEGPCVRTYKFKEDKAFFKTGDKIRLYADNIIGDNTKFSVDYPDLLKDLRVHSIFNFSSGVVLEVLELSLEFAVCEVVNGGMVESFSKLELPDIMLKRKFVNKQVKEDILFACEMNVDFLAISNVVSSENILEINDLLIELNNNNTLVIAKIQNSMAASDIEAIINVSEGIIVARNDLAITIPIEDIPIVKHDIIKKCINNGKISIVSADLESFLNEKSVPSRSEVSDLVNTVFSGVDAIMLSSETTIGNYPTEAIKQVERIINTAEKNVDYEYFFESISKSSMKNIAGTIASGSIHMAITLSAKAIVVATDNGFSARQISRFRPYAPIIAIVPNDGVAKSLNLYFGVIAVVISDYDFETLTSKAVLVASKILNLNDGDKIIVVGGYPFNKNKNNNFILVNEIRG